MKPRTVKSSTVKRNAVHPGTRTGERSSHTSGGVLGVVATVAGGLVAGVAAAAALGGAIGTQLARVAVNLDASAERPVRVLRVTEGERTVVWLLGEGSAALGAHSLLCEPAPAVRGGRPTSELGHARLGPVCGRASAAELGLAGEGGSAPAAAEVVAREVIAVERGTLRAGDVGRMTGWWYTAPEELGFRVERVQFPSELGELDAWIVHPRWPRKRRWAIHVHGRGADPVETLRGVTPLAQAGVTSMVIHYRNDPGQPGGLNGRYGMGLSESRDVDAAIAYARTRGAERITLVGWSMGGTACLVAATRGQHRDLIDGLVLDSPAVDWPGLLLDQARQRRLPGAIATFGMRLLERDVVVAGEPGGLPLTELTPEQFAADLRVPVLLAISESDTLVPWDGAKRLAQLAPELVQTLVVPGAGHVRLWNADPERWEHAVANFVRALPKPAWRGQ